MIHELAESSTDPFVQSNTAYGDADNNHIIWDIATGGEVSDMCDDNADTNFTPEGAKYMIQRSWSERRGEGGEEPLRPPTRRRTRTSTASPSSTTVSRSATTARRSRPRARRSPSGPTGTVEVQLYSEAPTKGPWTVTAWDYNDYNGFGAKNINVTFMETGTSTATGSNGDTLHLVVKVNSYDSSLGGAGFVLESDLGTQDNLWFAAIGQ